MKLSFFHLLLLAPIASVSVGVSAAPSSPPLGADPAALARRSLPASPLSHSTASTMTHPSFYSRLTSILLPRRSKKDSSRRSTAPNPEGLDRSRDYLYWSASSNVTGAISHAAGGSSVHNGGAEGEASKTRDMQKRSYPRCSGAPTKGAKKRKMLGVAHYPGWKLTGDDLSGAVPVAPRANCAHICSRYGSACAGIYYDDARSQCYLKGTKTGTWLFSESSEAVEVESGRASSRPESKSKSRSKGQHEFEVILGLRNRGADGGTDLLGGCAAWAGFVPPEMDEVCCRD